jgi:hypothetical protein
MRVNIPLLRGVFAEMEHFIEHALQGQVKKFFRRPNHMIGGLCFRSNSWRFLCEEGNIVNILDIITGKKEVLYAVIALKCLDYQQLVTRTLVN